MKSCRRINPNARAYLIGIVLMAAITGCNNSGGIGNDTPEVNRQPNQWDQYAVALVHEVGTSLPHVTAKPDTDGNVHIAFYNAVTLPDETSYHQLNHLLWHPDIGSQSQQVIENKLAPSGVDGFDRCAQFDFALDANRIPVFTYPVEEVYVPLAQIEADIMINFNENGAWSEFLGAIGFVERNPVYFDGHATSNMSVAIDSHNDIHIAYQFFTEGMDSANYRYPDLFYIHRARASLDQTLSGPQFGAMEEPVDGNTFSTYGVHNSVGYHCKLILDAQDRPVIVYAEHSESYAGIFALKMAFKNDAGNWVQEIVEVLPAEWKIGSISAAFYPDGSLGIAYALKAPAPEPDNAHRLKFASNESGEWLSVIVDESTWCGDHCSLAIDSEGVPAIAYYDEQSHSNRTHRFLKFAQFDGLRWVRQTVDEYANTGLFNTLWFDTNDTPFICSYSDEDNEIYIFERTR
ncbi:MAG: hypothetical protein JRH15_00180 [Deltaproteobacteria bacterium]|nr:hypothetical protein [Deltaproteobacteria bacterium]